MLEGVGVIPEGAAATAGAVVMTRDEEMVVYALDMAACWYGRLTELHGSDASEFAQALHACQNIVMARPALRQVHMERGTSKWSLPRRSDGKEQG
ncbi:MAG: hypothetical protein KAW17_09550 [Candidatus Eisenbacteria sp.]|nr:hypothetical protein [Candidatus Eisenbacteria bacterium]